MADFLEVQKRALEVREMYLSKPAQTGVNVLLYGDWGTGKTTFASTCPTPVFVDSFDPQGTIVEALQPLIRSGDVIVESRWEDDSWKKPHAFSEWETEMERRMKMGFFEHFGTYMLDSLTRFSESCLWQICKKAQRPGQPYQLQDYNVQQLTIVDWLGQIAMLPCHTVITGHIEKMQDQVSGAMETGLLLAGKLSEKVSLAFVEKWVTRVVRGQNNKNEYKVQTHPEGIYRAETRIGGSRFSTFEEPNFRELLKKAGYPAEDKPSFFKKES